MIVAGLCQLIDRCLEAFRRGLSWATSSPKPTTRLHVEQLENRLAPANLLAVQGMSDSGTTQSTAVEPPDTILAASSSNVVEAVNIVHQDDAFEVFRKDGSVSVAPTSFQSFFQSGSVYHGLPMIDPYVVFDELTNHFIMGGLELLKDQTPPTADQSYYDFAVSTDGTATAWSYYTLDAGLTHLKSLRRLALWRGQTDPFMAAFQAFPERTR
jgi:hypothetical protein